MSESLANSLALINDVLQAAIVIFGSAVVLYNVPHWRRDRVTRSFSNLIFFVVVVYFTELLASRTLVRISTAAWLRLGWVGIALVPAAQFHLSDALLVTTGYFSRRRRLAVRLSYLSGVALLGLVFGSDLIAHTVVPTLRAPHLQPGALFPLFVLYFWLVVAAGIYNVVRARLRCITPTTRRRMSVILAAFLAAPLAVFPYQLVSNTAEISLLLWLVLILGNVVVGSMFSMLTYYLAYFGRVSPDRVVRVRLFKYMARVPLTATLVLLAYVLANRASVTFGLPAETLAAILVVATMMVVEWAIHQFKRLLERLFQLSDEPEVRRIQELSERILTTRDLHQFLESILAATCDTLRTPSGFVAAITPQGPQLEVVVGPLRAPADLWQSEPWHNLAGTNATEALAANLEVVDRFVLWGNYWIRPLYSRKSEMMLGILGLLGRSERPNLADEERDIFERLAEQAAAALEDRILQQEVFAAVEGLLPEITALQRQRSAATYGSGAQVTRSLTAGRETPVDDPQFTNMVRDALSHFWGGPKLTESPLLGLAVVQEAMQEHGGNAAKALRVTLQRAIEQQRPEGERRLTTAEWILYNILELKFIQGQKVRDVARRLAMSESDLYRKQRVAIENVARALSRMEREALISNGRHPDGESHPGPAVEAAQSS